MTGWRLLLSAWSRFLLLLTRLVLLLLSSPGSLTIAPAAARRCLQFVNEEHFALREFFCITCDPDQYKYMSMTKDDQDSWGEIRICESFAERVWPSVSTDGGEDFAYDRCGFSIWTAGVAPEMVCMDSSGAATSDSTKATCEATADNSWQMKNGDWAFVDSVRTFIAITHANQLHFGNESLSGTC